jgi:hypothetical protein
VALGREAQTKLPSAAKQALILLLPDLDNDAGTTVVRGVTFGQATDEWLRYTRDDRQVTEIGATPAARASLASVAKRSMPAISPTSLAAIKGPKPGWSSRCGATVFTSAAISFSRVDRRRQLAQVASPSRAIRTLVVCSARASLRAIRGPQTP